METGRAFRTLYSLSPLRGPLATRMLTPTCLTAAHCNSTFGLYPYYLSAPVKSVERTMPHVLDYAVKQGLMVDLSENPLVVVVAGRKMIMAKGHEINNLTLETVICGDKDDQTIKRRKVRTLSP
eukprot:4604989-Pyramimonas_sp.AAC.2